VSHDDVARGGPGGKGRGAWLYISHDPVPMSEDTDLMSLFGLQRSREQPHVPTTPPSVFIHLKFEPMVQYCAKEKSTCADVL
jgi:tRNA wybutosine-synthesizing protein 3